MKGLVQRHPETREKMAKYAVEAAWQLAQWEDIGVAEAAPAKDWSVALANLLKCVHTEDREAVVTVGRSLNFLLRNTQIEATIWSYLLTRIHV